MGHTGGNEMKVEIKPWQLKILMKMSLLYRGCLAHIREQRMEQWNMFFRFDSASPQMWAKELGETWILAVV